MKRLGIDIGSTTVKVAVIDEEHNLLFSEYQRHFARIKETLDKIQVSVSTLQLWLEEKKAEGEIEEDAFS